MSIPKTFNQIFGAPEHPSPLVQSAPPLIDIQREYVDGAAPLENVQEAALEAGKLLALARERGVPVFHIAHGAGPGRAGLRHRRPVCRAFRRRWRQGTASR